MGAFRWAMAAFFKGLFGKEEEDYDVKYVGVRSYDFDSNGMVSFLINLSKSEGREGRGSVKFQFGKVVPTKEGEAGDSEPVTPVMGFLPDLAHWANTPEKPNP